MAQQSKNLQDLMDETRRLSKEVDRHLKALRAGTTAELKSAKKR